MKDNSCSDDAPIVPNGEILKKTRKYFDEGVFRKTLEEYKKTLVFRDKLVVSKNDKLETSLILQIEKIVNAIIIVYRYYIFEDYDDLKQHALNAYYTNFLKFTPDKGSAFNYFSIISKISLTGKLVIITVYII